MLRLTNGFLRLAQNGRGIMYFWDPLRNFHKKSAKNGLKVAQAKKEGFLMITFFFDL